ncbi:MAG: hypothetical protein L0323_09465 [Planctomycetes bacterium]|nr:hypothetical protein [Planctomycetota bacterium]
MSRTRPVSSKKTDTGTTREPKARPHASSASTATGKLAFARSTKGRTTSGPWRSTATERIVNRSPRCFS